MLLVTGPSHTHTSNHNALVLLTLQVGMISGNDVTGIHDQASSGFKQVGNFKQTSMTLCFFCDCWCLVESFFKLKPQSILHGAQLL